MNLEEKDLGGVRVVDGFDLVRKNFSATAWKVDVKVDIVMDDTGIG